MSPRGDTSVRLEETSTELLLFISAHQKERAKRIEGRVWDPGRVCWVYPRLPLVYDAIIAEFGDELRDLRVGRPHAPVSDDAQLNLEAPGPSEENAALRREVEELKRALAATALSDEPKTDSEIELRSELTERERRIATLERRLATAEALSDERALRITDLEEKIDDLVVQMSAAKSGAGMKKTYDQILRWAVQGSANNKEFVALLKSITSLERYPLDLAVALERLLRRRLRSDDDVSLYDLISEAEEAEVLSREAIDLAHTLRKQRNIVAHNIGESSVVPARALLSLYAACLLWRSL